MLKWWTSSNQLEEAEAAILHDVLTSPHLSVSQKFVDVFPRHSLNTLEVSPKFADDNEDERGLLENKENEVSESQEESEEELRESKGKEEVEEVEEVSQEHETHSNGQTLVMAHGYGSGIGLWYRNLEPIITGAKAFLRIMAFDWPGFGRSSRVPWNIEEFSSHVTHPKAFYDEPEGDQEVEDDLHHYLNDVDKVTLRRLRQTENFFIESLEKWREEMKLEQFVLLGHSLGGYFASVYALRYPNRIKTLILASPAGIPPPPPTPPEYRSNVFKVLLRLWSWRVAPQSAVRLAGPLGSKLVDKAAKWRFDLEGEESELVSKYLYHITAAAPSGERVLFDVLAPGAYAHSPLQSRLSHLSKDMNVCFIYGYYDWMDYHAARPICESLGTRAQLYIVADAGHQLYLENPTAFNSLISHICDHSDGLIPPPNIPDVFLY